MFDGAIPIPKSGGGGIKDDVQLHITLIVTISKGGGEVLEVMCSAWPDSIEITKLFICRSKKMPAQAYVGPEFRYAVYQFALDTPLSYWGVEGKEKRRKKNSDLYGTNGRT